MWNGKVASVDIVNFHMVPFPDVSVCAKASTQWRDAINMAIELDTEDEVCATIIVFITNDSSNVAMSFRYLLYSTLRQL